MTLKKLDDRRYSIPTRLIYGESYTEKWDYSCHLVPPITASSTFRLESTERGAEGFGAIGQPADGSSVDPLYVYQRMAEPNNDLLQNSLAIAEQGESAVVFSTGMAAVHAAVTFALPPGAEIVSHRTVYGCTYSLFTQWMPKFGFKVNFTDLRDVASIEPLINERTRLIYIESPVNPSMELIDIRAVTDLAKRLNASRSKENQILTAIDNTFSTPWCQRPITHGVDIVIHSLTKGLSGFGIEMGGAVITRKEFFQQLVMFRKDFGGSLAPMTAWGILVHGLPSLSIRVPRQQENALKVAQFLEAHPLVAEVQYPGLPSFSQYDLARRQMIDYHGNFAPGFMLSFNLKGGSPEESRSRGRRMMDYIADNAFALTLAVSLGQIRTLIEHPGSMTHLSYSAEEQLARGMHPGLIRLAVGIEHADDIITDLAKALENC